MTTKVFNALAAATTVAGIMATAGAANAASLSYTSSVAPEKTDFSAPLSVQKFNSSLGTLDSVILEFASSISGNGTVTNTGNTRRNFSLLVSSDINLKDANNNIILSVSPTADLQTISVGAGQTAQFSTVGATDTASQTLTSGALFQSFIGSGNLNFLFSTAASSGVLGSGNFNSAVETFAEGFLKVTYNYTEKTKSVPEPSALLGIGVITGFGAISKKKKWLKMAN